jgi:hypothetical protein
VNRQGRRVLADDIIQRLDSSSLRMPAHVSIALRRIIERHGHVEADGDRCIVCRQEAPCPDLNDALRAVLGLSEAPA